MKNIELVVGMKLTVREDLKIGMECLSGVVGAMLEFAGREVTVVQLWFDSFKIEEDGWMWHWNECMFKEFTEESI